LWTYSAAQILAASPHLNINAALVDHNNSTIGLTLLRKPPDSAPTAAPFGLQQEGEGEEVDLAVLSHRVAAAVNSEGAAANCKQQQQQPGGVELASYSSTTNTSSRAIRADSDLMLARSHQQHLKPGDARLHAGLGSSEAASAPAAAGDLPHHPQQQEESDERVVLLGGGDSSGGSSSSTVGASVSIAVPPEAAGHLSSGGAKGYSNPATWPTTNNSGSAIRRSSAPHGGPHGRMRRCGAAALELINPPLLASMAALLVGLTPSVRDLLFSSEPDGAPPLELLRVRLLVCWRWGRGACGCACMGPCACRLDLKSHHAATIDPRHANPCKTKLHAKPNPMQTHAISQPPCDHDPQQDVIRMFGDCCIPALMLMVGATLERGPGSGKLPARVIVCVTAARLVVLPLLGVAWVLAARAVGLLGSRTPRLLVLVALIQNAVP